MAERNERDAYFTPPPVTRCLLHHMPIRRFEWSCVGEPFVGDGWIGRELLNVGYDVVFSDIAAGGWVVEGEECDFFTQTARQKYQNVDAIVTNPPWSESARAVRRALEIAPNVAMLLRLTFLEPCDDRADLLRNGHLRQVIVLPRISFYRGESGTDSVPPAWFVWSEESGATHLHVVSKREYAEAAGQQTLFEGAS